MKTAVRVVFFATAREAVGAPSVDWEIPRDGVALAVILSELVKEHPRLAPVLQGSRLVRNGRALRGTRIRVVPGDEIAVHPPYSGG